MSKDDITKLKKIKKQVNVVKKENKKLKELEELKNNLKDVKAQIPSAKKYHESGAKDKNKKDIYTTLIKQKNALEKKIAELENKEVINEACVTTKKRPKPPVKKKVTNEEIYVESALAESIKMGNYESIKQELVNLVRSIGDKGLTQAMAGVSISNGILADRDLAFLWNRTISNPNKYFNLLINKLKNLARGREKEKQGEGWADE
jgi:alanyl-tRNA synthetase